MTPIPDATRRRILTLDMHDLTSTEIAAATGVARQTIGCRHRGSTGSTVDGVPVTEKRKFTLTVMGNPIPKSRARVTLRGAYTPQTTRDYETLVRDAAAMTWLYDEPMQGLLSVELAFYRANRRRADFDNLCKSVVDALQGIVLINDDQIVHAVIWKRIDRDNPRVEIAVIQL